MSGYHPPLDHYRFLLRDVFNVEALGQTLPAYRDVDWDTVNMMLEGTAEFARDVMAPLNRIGDEQGCTFNPATNGVKTPDGFKDAYRQLRELGMIGMTGSPELGGAGLPAYLATAVNEMLMSANFSLAAYPGLTGAAARALEKMGSNELKQQFIPKMYSGEWTGTMCLTEPHAGTDLGMMRTKAVPGNDGTYRIHGAKCFITGGEHDMADNICHLVLARMPDAPEGVRGISLFLVPKFLPDDSGNPGERNAAMCTGIEHKMGINGSATCSMSFDGAKGWLVGKPNKGLAAMFIMMNDARMKAGLQGLSMAEAALQKAAAYAQERVQGKPIMEATNPNAPSVPIINHTNVRRDLMEMMCQVEGLRALGFEAAIHIDKAEKHPSGAERKKADEYVSLLTPVIKASMTDLGCAASQKAVQLHGGSGFIRDTGVEQYYRDSLISTIYEGTNDIQAMDFTFRKVMQTLALPVGQFMWPMQDEILEARKNPALAPWADKVADAADSFRQVTLMLANDALANKLDHALAQSRDYMDMFGRMAVGRMWLKMMSAAQARLDQVVEEPRADFYRERLAFGRCYMTRIMKPDMDRLKSRIEAGVDEIVNSNPQNFVPGRELSIAV